MATEGTVVGVALTQIESQRLGYHAISLTNFDTDAAPDIAAGSKAEIGGALYNFSGTTSISNFSAIATAASPYIYLTPAGTAVTAAGTVGVLGESDSKQGWYSWAARAIGLLTKASTAGYADKAVFLPGHRWVDTALAHGTYTATAAGVSNIDSVAVTKFFYTRVGAVVSAVVTGTLDAGSAATDTRFTLTLPVASALAVDADVCGCGVLRVSGTPNTFEHIRVTADTVNDLIDV